MRPEQSYFPLCQRWLTKLREELIESIERHCLRAVISMPNGLPDVE
jgi:hypothetical protein